MDAPTDCCGCPGPHSTTTAPGRDLATATKADAANSPGNQAAGTLHSTPLKLGTQAAACQHRPSTGGLPPALTHQVVCRVLRHSHSIQVSWQVSNSPCRWRTRRKLGYSAGGSLRLAEPS
ncbi:hypothetical protein NDU88_004733 [Pleurodeles waltl]|uniref:Uncharacterized protein n=1 Tax=Pleurodeles waltl TaxID=8319 RepID=A0AAV7LJL0_PLEWA|nr:hypothetical protein NDU88_004733 [Pleurodeles waltl]